MDKVAQAINVFPTEEEQASSAAAILVPLDTLQAILKGLNSLSREVQDLRKRVKRQEILEEIYHGPAPQEEDIHVLRDIWERKREEIGDLPMLFRAMEEDLSALEKEVHSKEPRAPGRKSVTRIERLKEILKQSGGSRTFGQLQKDLELSPSQFSQLINKLDKRVFEVARRPNGKRGEKVLKLRVRIGVHWR